MKPSLFTKHGIVAGRAHQEQKGKRQHEVRARCKEGLPRQIFRFVVHRRAIGRVVGGPLDDFFLRAPDYSPDVQHHHPAHPAADTDGEQPIALPAMIVEAQKETRRRDHDDGVDRRQHQTFVERTLARNLAGVHQRPGDSPDHKEVAIGPPEDAPPFLASEATMLPQYARPISTVSTELQRNHQRARDIRLGRTLPLVTGSSPFMNGTLTRLKKYSRPSQVTPPTKCSQRNNIKRLVLGSVGKCISIKLEAPVSKLCAGTDDCRWLARKMKLNRFVTKSGKDCWARQTPGHSG